MLVQQGKPMDYSCFPIAQYEGAAEAVSFGSMGELLAAFTGNPGGGPSGCGS